MTQMPVDARPAEPRWPAPGDGQPRRRQQAPAYDAGAERLRTDKLAAQRERWESGSSALPIGPNQLQQTHRHAQPRESPFATEGSTARADDSSARPRGRQQHALSGHESQASSDEFVRRGRRGAPEDSRSGKSSFGGGMQYTGEGGDGLLVAAMGGSDAFAIGNPRAENFVLRTRATKRVGIVPASQVAVEAPPGYYRPARRVFDQHHGGGRASVGFDGNMLSAELPEDRLHRRPVARVPSTNAVKPVGRRHVAPAYADALDHELDGSDARSRGDSRGGPDSARGEPQRGAAAYAGDVAVDELSAQLAGFANWYRSEYNEDPPQAALDHAVRSIVSQGRQEPTPRDDGRNAPQQPYDDLPRAQYGGGAPQAYHDEPQAYRGGAPQAYHDEPQAYRGGPPSSRSRDGGPPRAQYDDAPRRGQYDESPPRGEPAAPCDTQSAEFAAWYVDEYGRPPPAHLVQRAAKTFAVDGDAPRYAAPPRAPDSPTKRGPRPNAIGDDSGTQKNSILGRSSSRVSAPPGGRSSINLSWD
ncbi:hypothetical protein M885DRAFT_541231 [Pelagophyceae sp. CCMP2097]|nr:hypothetical protein M885DRAFT_541231 [Pelagophyceae sp. CCMP2097]